MEGNEVTWLKHPTPITLKDAIVSQDKDKWKAGMESRHGKSDEVPARK